MLCHRKHLIQVLDQIRRSRAQLEAEPYSRPSEQRDALDRLKEQGRRALAGVHEEALREVATEQERIKRERRAHDSVPSVDGLTVRWAEMVLAIHKPMDVLALIQTREQAAAIRALAPASFIASLAPGQLASPDVKAAIGELDRACDLREREFISATARDAREREDQLNAEVDAYLHLESLVEREVVHGSPLTPQERIAHGLTVSTLGLDQA